MFHVASCKLQLGTIQPPAQNIFVVTHFNVFHSSSVIIMNKQGLGKGSPVLLDSDDALGLSTFLAVSADHCTHSDDTGEPKV